MVQNLKRPKVLTIVGTRPELIKLSQVMKLLDQTVEHVFIHTGQNYDFELNEIFYRDLKIRKPDHFLNAVKNTAMATTAEILIKVDELLESLKPDAVLLYGDTNSTLCGIAVKRKRIPLFHMEAGNRSFDKRVPEELNRKIIDHISDINFTNSEVARQHLILEGLPIRSIIMAGSPMREVLQEHQTQIKNSQVLEKLSLKKQNFFVVSLHREENVDSPEKLKTFLGFLESVSELHRKEIVFSVHPRTEKRLQDLGLKPTDRKFTSLKPLGFCDYVHLQSQALCTISDSGTITEESSILGFRALTPRAAHERPEGTDQGVLIKSPMEESSLMNALQTTLKLPPPSLVPDYAIPDTSIRVVKAILSQIDQIQRNNWFLNSL